ncbi:MAG: hypothetical protein NTW02_12630 [Cyanobium sp. LacPavin_0920_WC12_MAG_62_9]|nr:hypothetical protein [Cyanobium sp. LacPavin_0920_WC12_MAG_62_9]
MPLTTAEAFNQFKEKLLLTDPQNNLIKSRRTTVAGYLAESFTDASDLPLSTTKVIGSASRSTIIRPLDDIDILAVFNNKNEIFERLFRNDSQKFLYRIRDALNKYKVEVVGARGQAVRLFYKQAPHVDIAPVFRWSSGGYALPNGTGGWLTTDPDAHELWINQRHGELSNRLKPMIRMIKRWNNVHSKYLKGFHLEVMLANVFTSIGGDSRDACAKFFQWGPSHLNVPDPAGHSADLSAYLSHSARTNLLSNMRSAQNRAAQANAAEAEGNHQEANRIWRIVFGDEFPS